MSTENRTQAAYSEGTGSTLTVQECTENLNKSHLFIRTKHRSIFIQIVPLHVCYMFRPVLRSSFVVFD